MEGISLSAAGEGHKDRKRGRAVERDEGNGAGDNPGHWSMARPYWSSGSGSGSGGSGSGAGSGGSHIQYLMFAPLGRWRVGAREGLRRGPQERG